MAVFEVVAPCTHGFVNGVFEGCRAAGHRHHFGTEQTHAVNVQGLANGVFFAHVHDAFHAHECRGGGGGHAMLTGAGLSNEAGLAHFFGEQRLTEGIVDFVRAGVVEVLALEVDLGATEVAGHVLSKVKSGWTAHIIVEQGCQLRIECWVVFVMLVSLFQFYHCTHQGFWDVLTAVNAEASFLIHRNLSLVSMIYDRSHRVLHRRSAPPSFDHFLLHLFLLHAPTPLFRRIKKRP